MDINLVRLSFHRKKIQQPLLQLHLKPTGPLFFLSCLLYLQTINLHSLAYGEELQISSSSTAQLQTASPILNAQNAEYRIFGHESESGKAIKVLQTELEKNNGQPITSSNIEKWLSELTQSLRSAGYPIGQVIITNENLVHAHLTAKVIFNVYLGEIGRLTVKNDSRVSDERIRTILETALCESSSPIGKGCVLETLKLERATQLLQDIPGVGLENTSVGADGVGTGQTHLMIHSIELGLPYALALSADNQGSSATGLQRYGVSLSGNNFMKDGDIYLLSLTTTPEDFVSGTLLVNAPFKYSGLRWTTSLSRTTYSIDQNILVRGIANTATLGLIYPFARGLDRNMHGALDILQTKTSTELLDFSTATYTHLQSIRATFLANNGSRLRQGNLYQWNLNLSATAGHQKNNDSLDIGPQRAGHYSKFSHSFSLQQNFPYLNNVFMMLNERGQNSNRNLDYSEKLALGGANGVRAYRGDEGSVDDGVLVSLDLKYVWPLQRSYNILTGIFTDAGYGRINHSPWQGWESSYPTIPNISNKRTLKGYGLSMEVISQNGLKISLEWAKRFPSSEDSWIQSGSADSRIWASINWNWSAGSSPK